MTRTPPMALVPVEHLKKLQWCETILESLMEHGVQDWEGWDDAIANIKEIGGQVHETQ